jgi:hypothetical protein
MKSKVLENEYIRFWIENRILFSEYKKPINLDLNIGVEIIKLRHEISAGEKQYWCYDFKNIISMPSETKEHAAKYGQEYLHATAVIVYNHLQKFIVNIFISLKKPTIPFMAFTDKEKALQWLKLHQEKNEHLCTEK